VSIPPIPINGVNTCPQGYALSPDGSECIPISPPISVDVTGVAAAEIDYVQQGLKSALGWLQSGTLEHLIVSALSSFGFIFQSLIAKAMSLYDSVLAALGVIFLGAQAQGTAGFYELAASLMSDLLGIEVDGAKLWADLQSKGRVAAMTDLGGALFQTLASEFAGEAQKQQGQRFIPTPGVGMGGLPVKNFGPGDGIAAAKSFIGFVTAFAIREGNTDVLRDLPIARQWGLLDTFKDFAEDFSKGLGLGRMMRVALRPLMQAMVALPLQNDLYAQYRPVLLGQTEALRAWKASQFTDDELAAELAMHGFSDRRIAALKIYEDRPLAFRYYQTLRASRKVLPAMLQLTDDDISARLRTDNYDVPTSQSWMALEDIDPARRVSLLYVEHYVTLFLQGHITFDAITNFLKQAQSARGVLLTDGEWLALNDLVNSVSVNPVLRVRHLSFFSLQLAYIDGTITLDELETHLQQLGYSDSDITILTLETLFKSKERAAAAAAKAAKGKTGKATAGSALAGLGGAPLP
jgi:hypothetical protein